MPVCELLPVPVWLDDGVPVWLLEGVPVWLALPVPVWLELLVTVTVGLVLGAPVMELVLLEVAVPVGVAVAAGEAPQAPPGTTDFVPLQLPEEPPDE